MLFYGGLSPIAALRLFSTSGRDCVAAVPWSYSAAAAMQGHKSFCAAVQTESPDPRAVRACSCKPSLPSWTPTIGWELKKFTKSNTRQAIQAEIFNQMQQMKVIQLCDPSEKKIQKVSHIKWKFLPLWSEKTLQLIVTSPPRSWPQRDRNSIDFRWSAIGEIVSQGRREFSD